MASQEPPKLSQREEDACARVARWPEFQGITLDDLRQNPALDEAWCLAVDKAMGRQRTPKQQARRRELKRINNAKVYARRRAMELERDGTTGK